MTLLRAFDLSLSFGSRTLFSNLELVIEEGERVGLVGVNGCGKSHPDEGAHRRGEGRHRHHPGAARHAHQPPRPGARLPRRLHPLHRALGRPAAPARRARRARPPLGVAGAHLRREGARAPLGAGGEDRSPRRLGHRLRVAQAARPPRRRPRHVGSAHRAALGRPEEARGHRPRAAHPRRPAHVRRAHQPPRRRDGGVAAGRARLARLGAAAGHARSLLPRRPGGSDHRGRAARLRAAARRAWSATTATTRRTSSRSSSSCRTSRPASTSASMWIAQEVAWLRRGPKARATKSKARIDRARKLLSEKGFQRPKVPDLQLAAAPRLSQTVIEATHVCKSFGELEVLDNVNVILQPGERMGLVGKNGAGKTTLIRTLLGEIKPDSRHRAPRAQDARGALRPAAHRARRRQDRLRGRLGRRLGDPGRQEDAPGGVPRRSPLPRAHAAHEGEGPLGRRAQPAACWRGSSSEGANVLVLDEPTNDLDLVTLNVLERLLMQFTGAVLLVTHDRYFLDKVATGLLVFEGEGKVVRHEGNYDLYRRLAGAVEEGRGRRPSSPAAWSAPRAARVRGSAERPRTVDPGQVIRASAMKWKKTTPPDCVRSGCARTRPAGSSR